MKRLEINRLNVSSHEPRDVTMALNLEGEQLIDNLNWKNYPYQPQVSFRMGYTKDALHILFKINERAVRAVNDQPNGSVWEDSCCEFFCDFDDKGYYNLETNCIGTQLLGWGEGKSNRQHADVSLIRQIRCWSSLGNVPFDVKQGDFNYEIVMSIPAESFYAHELKFVEGMTFRANFYKCGDKTPDMHFLSWNPIPAASPNFHLPEFFGEVALK